MRGDRRSELDARPGPAYRQCVMWAALVRCGAVRSLTLMVVPLIGPETWRVVMGQ